jgi:hypothetical protein
MMSVVVMSVMLVMRVRFGHLNPCGLGGESLVVVHESHTREIGNPGSV